MNRDTRSHPLMSPTVVSAVALEDSACDHLDRCSAVHAGRRTRLDAASAQMQYLAHPGTHEICNHHKAGCIEHVDEIAQILNPEDPLDAPGGIDRYRPDRIKDRNIAVGVLANTRERIGHGHAVCLSGSKHIDGPHLQELDGPLDQRDGNRVRRVLAIAGPTESARELAWTTAHEWVYQKPVPELIAKPEQVRQHIVVLAQRARRDIVTMRALAPREHMSELQDRFDIELLETTVSLAVHPDQKWSHAKEMPYRGTCPLRKAREERSGAHRRDQLLGSLAKRFIGGISESATTRQSEVPENLQPRFLLE